jgi:predicted ArsR family transcriptional regulator
MAFPLFAKNEDTKESDNKKIKELGQKIQFIQTRMAKFINILDKKMDEADLNKVLEALGTECSKEYETHYKAYEANLEGFLEAWDMNFKHDKEKMVITILGKETTQCFCPFVKESLMAPDFCNCSIGWQQQTFSTLIGKPVKVEVIESVLRGGKSCNFVIDYS